MEFGIPTIECFFLYMVRVIDDGFNCGGIHHRIYLNTKNVSPVPMQIDTQLRSSKICLGAGDTILVFNVMMEFNRCFSFIFSPLSSFFSFRLVSTAIFVYLLFVFHGITINIPAN